MARLKFAIGTRCHNKDTSESLEDLRTFLNAATKISDCVLVGVDTVLLAERVATFRLAGVTAVVVAPWGFSSALNALCLKSRALGYEQILFASIDFPPELDSVEGLSKHLLDDVVMVGAATIEHDYQQKPCMVRNADAMQMPWNTFALVSTDKLISTGVPPITDDELLGDDRGMEEAVTLAMQSKIGNTAVLTRVPRVWRFANTNDNHGAKMESKNARARKQLEMLGLESPTVHHK
jgi:hypothetical protein